MNKLTFKGIEYNLIEVQHPKFRIYGEGYEDIGFDELVLNSNMPVYACFSLRIKDKYYGLKLVQDK